MDLPVGPTAEAKAADAKVCWRSKVLIYNSYAGLARSERDGAGKGTENFHWIGISDECLLSLLPKHRDTPRDGWRSNIVSCVFENRTTRPFLTERVKLRTEFSRQFCMSLCPAASRARRQQNEGKQQQCSMAMHWEPDTRSIRSGHR